MPTFSNVASALRRYEGRYECLDVFADDVEELTRDPDVRVFDQAGYGGATVETSVARLHVRVFPQRGIVRFRLSERLSGNDVQVEARAERDQLASAVSKTKETEGEIVEHIQTAISVASKVKEGLLGGLVVGMLVGEAKGTGAHLVERVLALTFDPETDDWQVYDGPLLRWAKRTLQPAVAPAA